MHVIKKTFKLAYPRARQLWKNKKKWRRENWSMLPFQNDKIKSLKWMKSFVIKIIVKKKLRGQNSRDKENKNWTLFFPQKILEMMTLLILKYTSDPKFKLKIH